jgi:hypothetical protein
MNNKIALTDDDMKVATMLALRYGHVDKVYRMWRLAGQAHNEFPEYLKPGEKIELNDDELRLMRKIQTIHYYSTPIYTDNYEFVE